MSANYFEELGDIYNANILEEGESVGKQDQLDTGTEGLDHTGPEAAEGFEPAKSDSKDDEEGHAEKLGNPVNKKEEKPVKKESVEINNSNMKDNTQNTNKSTFDRLFEDVMGGDLDMELGGGDDLDLGGEDEGLGDEEGGDSISIDLPRDVAEQLHSALGDLLGGDDDLGDVDDIEDIEDGGDEFENIESHVELQNAPDSISSLTGMNNKAGLAPDGGSADSSASGQEDGGAPKAAADGKGKLQGKSNKVADLKGNAFSK